MLTDRCPDPDQLAAFYDGTLPTDAHLRTAEHLRRCEHCRERSAAAGRPVPTSRTFPDPSSHPANEPETAPPLSAGVIGPYKLGRLIGRGGMGAVYETVHERLGKTLALKVLPRLAAFDPEYLARFEREVKAAGRLDHPNVVRATDAGEDQGIPYLVMELVDGVDLSKLLRAHPRLPVGDVAEIGRQAATALDHAHSKGIVHRDVKPSNLMLTRDGVVKLLDLGLAVFVTVVGRADERITGPTFLGTQDYMAPEQWTAPAEVNDRADVYGLGCVLFQALCGRAPFSGAEFNSVAERREAHLHRPPPDPRSERPETPVSVAQLVSRMLAKRPEARPSAAEVTQALADLGSGPARLARLAELTRMSPTEGVQDTQPTAHATPTGETDPLETRVRATPPLAITPALQPTPTSPPTPPLGLFILALAVIGLVLLGGLVFIAAGLNR